MKKKSETVFEYHERRISEADKKMPKAILDVLYGSPRKQYDAAKKLYHEKGLALRRGKK